jgi:hypothetical protein
MQKKYYSPEAYKRRLARQRVISAARYERHRDWLNAQKTGPCQKCGGVFHTAAMQFHHRDPAEKSFNIGNCAWRSEEVLMREIAKCDLLCANCHAVVEWSS